MIHIKKFLITIIFVMIIFNNNSSSFHIGNTSIDIDNYDTGKKCGLISPNPITIYGQSTIKNDFLKIELSIYNKVNKSVVISLDEFYFLIDTNKNVKFKNLENNFPPTSQIIIFDSTLMDSKYEAKSNEIKINKKLPRFIVIEDSAHLIISKKINPEEKKLLVGKNKIFTLMHYSYFSMLSYFLDLTNINYKPDAFISNYVVKNDFPEKITNNIIYEINLFENSNNKNHCYYTNNRTDYKLTEIESKYLSILFFNFITCQFNIEKK